MRPLIALAAVFCATVSVPAQDWKKALESELIALYPITKMNNELFAGRTAIRDPGAVVTAQQAGIPATDGGGADGEILTRA
jgi:hypothetical protein